MHQQDTSSQREQVTGTGHIVGATYKSRYWGDTYKVIGPAQCPFSGEMKAVEVLRESGRQHTHGTHVGRDQVIA